MREIWRSEKKYAMYPKIGKSWSQTRFSMILIGHSLGMKYFLRLLFFRFAQATIYIFFVRDWTTDIRFPAFSLARRTQASVLNYTWSRKASAIKRSETFFTALRKNGQSHCAKQLGNATDFLKLIAKIDHFCLGIGTDVNAILLLR